MGLALRDFTGDLSYNDMSLYWILDPSRRYKDGWKQEFTAATVYSLGPESEGAAYFRKLEGSRNLYMLIQSTAHMS